MAENQIENYPKFENLASGHNKFRTFIFIMKFEHTSFIEYYA
jgi:hypothetical protein